MTTATLPAELTVRIHQEIDINADVKTVFESVLEQMGPGFNRPDGAAMPFKLEAWPGGRWYRDLGNNAGHFWGHVQVIKPPTLLEICGPMMMSHAVASHFQYRLTAQGAGTRLELTHTILGEVTPEHRSGMNQGWAHILNSVKARCRP
jgi:hypothetical protein